MDCPDTLTLPLLHYLLQYSTVQYTWAVSRSVVIDY